MLFVDLRLSEPLLRAVASEGYTTATPIQVQAIPPVLDGRDVLGCAQTGTGKTAAFALPILQRLAAAHAVNGKLPRARCLVLCPTRELAVQIETSFRTYGKNLRLHPTAVYGGVGQARQVDALRRGADIIVATPGRLQDLMEQGYVDLRGIETLVLDEADRMLDMGFIDDIRRIVAKVPAQRQTLLFSATMPPPIRRLADTLLRNPVTLQIAPPASTADGIDQSVYFVERRNKPALLAHLLTTVSISRALVFTRTKHGADRVVRDLHQRGVRAEAIHGNKTQNNRQRALENFRSGKTHVLVATDIASRGIDVDGISHVVNFDLSHEPETYIHRIGRTARAGASGFAVSFCDREEVAYLKAIERLIRRPLTVKKHEGAFAAAPPMAAPAAPTGYARPPRREQHPGRPGERPHRHAATGSYGGHTPNSGAQRNHSGTHAPRPGHDAASNHAPKPAQGGATSHASQAGHAATPSGRTGGWRAGHPSSGAGQGQGGKFGKRRGTQRRFR